MLATRDTTAPDDSRGSAVSLEADTVTEASSSTQGGNALWWLRSVSFLQMLGVGLVLAYGGVWMKERGLNEAYIGQLSSLSTLLGFFAGFGWAILADRKQWTQQILFGGLLGAAACTAYLTTCSTATDFLIYALLRPLASGMVLSLLQLLAVSVLANHGAQGLGYASYRIFGSMGYIVGTLLIPQLTNDLVRLLLIGAAVTAVAALPLWRLRAPIRSQRHYVSPKLVLKNRALVPLFASLFLFAMASPAYLQFAPIYARELGASTEFIGLFCSMTGFVAVIGLPLTGRLVDRYGTRRLIWLALLTQPLRVAGYGLVGGEYWLLVVPQLMHAFTWAGLEIAGVLYVTRQALPGNQATALALYTGAQTMGVFLGASLSGHLAQHASYPLMYLVMAAIASLAIVVFIVASRIAAVPASGSVEDQS